MSAEPAVVAHWFVCAVCGARGGCSGQDEDGRGDDGEHVHFKPECWEVGPQTGQETEVASA